MWVRCSCLLFFDERSWFLSKRLIEFLAHPLVEASVSHQSKEYIWMLLVHFYLAWFSLFLSNLYSITKFQLVCCFVPFNWLKLWLRVYLLILNVYMQGGGHQQIIFQKIPAWCHCSLLHLEPFRLLQLISLF